MEKRQLLLMGLGLAFGLAALATVTLRRELERDEVDQEREQLLEQLPAPSQLGPFRLRPEEDGSTLFGPGGVQLAFLGPEADLRLGGTLGTAATLVAVEKDCADPCNPRSRIFLAEPQDAREIFDGPGLARLQDLDRDGVPELLLDLLVAEGEELLTLPLRFDGDGFVNGYKRFPDGVDRQLSNLGRAAEQACGQQVDEGCHGVLEALVSLALFRQDGQQAALFAGLALPIEARSWIEQSEERLRDELEGMLP